MNNENINKNMKTRIKYAGETVYRCQEIVMGIDK